MGQIRVGEGKGVWRSNLMRFLVWWAFLFNRFDVQDWLDVMPDVNSGTPPGRYWFGYVFRGGRVSVDDFQRAQEADLAEGSRAYR